MHPSAYFSVFDAKKKRCAGAEHQSFSKSSREISEYCLETTCGLCSKYLRILSDLVIFL